MGCFPEKCNDPPVLGRRITFSVESTLASVYMRKKLTHLLLANCARICSDCLPLTELTPLGEQCKLFIIVER